LKNLNRKLQNKNINNGGNPIQNLNVIPTVPGVYKIYCNQNNKTYYGESVNIAWRVGFHMNELQKQRHIIPSLQDDWNKYGPSAFAGYVLATGPIYNNRAERIKTEKSYIKNNPPHLTYNTRVIGKKT
jgi:group I intron endonuclease